MSAKQTWAEALQINPDKLAKWSALSPPGTPLLVWCLEKGYVSATQYLQWASTAYELPVLNEEYFNKEFDHNTLTQSRHAWDPWCYPVAVWEDVTIVACVEPPSEPPEVEGKLAFVLADPTVMLEVWSASKTRVTLDVEPPKPAAVDAPLGMDLTNKNFRLNLDVLAGESTVVKPPGAEDSIAVPTPPPVPKPPPKKAPPAAAAASPLVAPAKKGSVDEDAQFRKLIDELKKFHTGVLILRCTASEALFYKWDSSLEILNGSEAVSLATPSLLRIVSKTQLPYHGYVIDSPAHRELFVRLGLTALPPSVTAIPMLNDNKVWGICMAFGGETSQSAQALEEAQEAVDSFTAAMRGVWAKAA